MLLKSPRGQWVKGRLKDEVIGNNVNGLVQERHNSSAVFLSCTDPPTLQWRQVSVMVSEIPVKMSSLEYSQICNIKHNLVGNKIVDHSDVVGALPVGAAPTTSSFST